MAAVPTPPKHRRPLFAVLVATFFVRLAFGITLAVFASYITQHSTGLGGNDVGIAGVVSAMAPVGEFSTVLFSGALADRYGRWPVLLSGMGGAAVLFALVALTRNVVALGALNLLFGVGSGAILAASLAVIGDRAHEENRGYEMGRFDAVNLFGWTAGLGIGLGFLGSLSNDHLGWVFALGAGLLAAGLGVTVLLIRGSELYHGTPQYSFSTVMGNIFRKSVLLVTLPWLVIYVLIGTVLVFIGPATVGAGISPTLVGVVIAVGGVLLVLTQPYYGRLADRHGRTRLMTVGAIGFVGAMVSACFLISEGSPPQIPTLVALGISAVVALAYGPAALAALADLSFQMSRATTMAIYSLTISLGMVLGIAGSAELYAHFANDGLYAFFGTVGAALVVLTIARIRETGLQGGPPTTPAR
ncbi:MAG: MFS transporter [Thermoplasmata archaeon]